MTKSTTPSPVPRGWSGVRRSSEGERRHALRAAVDVPVEVIVDGFPHRCRTVDASATGMVVELTRALSLRAPEEIGTYELHVSPTKLLHVHGRTVWRRGVIQAVRFVGLRDEDRRAIHDMLSASLLRGTTDVDRLEAAERLDRLAAARHGPSSWRH